MRRAVSSVNNEYDRAGILSRVIDDFNEIVKSGTSKKDSIY